MKKKVLIPLAIVAVAALFASCDQKTCYCYERGADGRLIETQVYTDVDRACNALGNASRGCIESNERGTIDPEDIAK